MSKPFKAILAFFTDDLVTAGLILLWVAAIALLHRYAKFGTAKSVVFLMGIVGALSYGVFRRARQK